LICLNERGWRPAFRRGARRLGFRPSDGQAGSCAGPEVLFEEISPKPVSGQSINFDSSVTTSVSRYLPAYRIEGQKEDENGEASPFLLLKFVSDDVHWPHNDNRVHGKRY
jgi:hypothetical protein